METSKSPSKNNAASLEKVNMFEIRGLLGGRLVFPPHRPEALLSK